MNKVNNKYILWMWKLNTVECIWDSMKEHIAKYIWKKKIQIDADDERKKNCFTMYLRVHI